jgi:hypothetical protein
MWITSGGKIWICQNVRGLVSMGIIPYPHIRTPTHYTLTPTFYHRFLCSDSIMTTFSPLTISGRPFFYYIHFPDKKGRVSVRGGETNVVSVLEVLCKVKPYIYPPSTRVPICYIVPNEVDILCPFV